MSKLFDVAIVGLGPVGAILSALLARGGLETVVIDKADDIFPLPRAAGFDHEVMRVVQNLGLAEQIKPYVIPYPPTEYRSVGGKVIARYESLPPPYPLGWEPSFMFQQPPFERTIRRALSDLPALEVRLSTVLEGLSQNDFHVALTMTNASGAGETLRARYVVGCDGGTSLVRKLLGIDFESLDFDEPWLVADILVDEDSLKKLPKTVVQYCDPERPTTYVVGPGNHRRWEFMLLPGETAEAMNQEEAIWRMLDRWLTPSDGKVWRAATYVFHALVATEWRCGRVLLAGDAAHMTPPFMAQGMCQGVRDAANLAWKLALVIKGQAGQELLDTYQQERRPHVLATTETAKSLGRIICELDASKATERDARLLSENGEPPVVQYRQNLIPGLTQGALCADQGIPVGTRFPQPRIVTSEGVSLLDDVVGAPFRLVLSAELGSGNVPPNLREKLQDIGGVMLKMATTGYSCSRDTSEWSIVESGRVLNEWLRDHGLVAALVRPDHYVFAVARQASDLRVLDDLLDKHLFLTNRQIALRAG